MRDRRAEPKRDANIAQTTEIQQGGEGVQRESAAVEHHGSTATLQSTTMHWRDCGRHA